MRLAVADTETTGTGDHDQVLELAVTTLGVHPGEPGHHEEERWHTLVRPSVPCSFEARAVHHITDAELEGAPTLTGLLASRGLPEFDDSVVVAHNAPFDLKMMRQSGVDLTNPVICTYRCAKHLFPDAPRHSNQVLRYWLGLDDKYGSLTLEDLPPHRALADTVVTSRLLMEMLRLRTVEELVALSTQPVVLHTCGFGKHAGLEWAAVPSSYLQWIVSQGEERQVAGRKEGFDLDTRHTAMYHLGLVPKPLRALPSPPTVPSLPL